MSTLLAITKFFLFLLLSLVVVPIQLLVLIFTKGPKAYIIPKFWHKGACTIFGIKINIIGTPYSSSQTIYLTNHLSYFDIVVLGSILKASFVAKEDVESWPVFGFLSHLQQTAFISRSREKARQVAGTLEHMIQQEKNLILFPEGTSTDGQNVRPFKSSLFSIAFGKKGEQNTAFKIQPITLHVHSANGHTIKSQDDRDIYAWHIDMTTPMAKHLWGFAKTKGAEIDLLFHLPMDAKDYSERKTLAKACHDTVSKGHNTLKNQNQS